MDEQKQKITFFGDAPNPLREQRRYEIAKDCMAAMVANPQTRYDVTDEELAEYATSKANALLAELEKEPLT